MLTLSIPREAARRALLGALVFALRATAAGAVGPEVTSVLPPFPGAGQDAPGAGSMVEPPLPSPAPETIETHVLAPLPFCEASAALAAPWDEDVVLVADNERDAELYSFELAKDGTLKPGEVLQMPAKDRPRDVEALARLGDEVVAVGSQSRNKDCEVKPERQRLRRLGRRKDGTLTETGFIDAAPTWAKAMKEGEKRCLSTLFTSPPPAGAATVCEALLAAERNASPERCETVNVEGAFGIGNGDLWLGLRAPLAAGRAVLLRLAKAHKFRELRFDRVTLLDLEQRGIRELALSGDRLYGLAGPELDADAPFALFRAALSAVVAGGEPAVEVLRRDLPTSSEGLLVRGARAYVLTDGDAGDKASLACQTPAGWYTLDLP